MDVMEAHPQAGILSPCAKQWAEVDLIGDNNTKYFWYVHNVAYVMRRAYI